MPNINAVAKHISASLILLALLSIPLNGYSADPIKIIAYTNFPPYLYHQDGQITGLYMRIVALTLDAIDQPYTVETLPFKRGLVEAAAGNGIIIGIFKTDEREKTLDFSDPFYQERIVVFYNKPKENFVQAADQLAGLRIGTLLGWSYGSDFDQVKDENLFKVIDGELESNFYMLSKGRLDAVIHTELSSRYILNKLGLTNEVFLGSKPLELGDIYFAGKKGANQELLEGINQKLNDPDHQKKIELLIENYKK